MSEPTLKEFSDIKIQELMTSLGLPEGVVMPEVDPEVKERYRQLHELENERHRYLFNIMSENVQATLDSLHPNSSL